MYMIFIDGEIKPGKKDEFLKAWNGQIMPTLKKQDGFIDEILLFEEGANKPCGLCFWKTKEQAERYRRDVFPKIKQYVEHVMTGVPKLRGFSVERAETFKVTQRKAA